MADNVNITPGAGVAIAADEIDGVKHQRVKLSIGVDGVATDLAPGQKLAAASLPVTVASDDLLTARSVTNVFRDPCEFWDPGTAQDGKKWNASLGAGDFIVADGNAAGASYFVLSKNPLVEDTESYMEINERLVGPTRTQFGASISQRAVGQEIVFETVSLDNVEDGGTLIPAYSPVAISAAQQATTTLTITTSANHNLVPGDRVAIYGVSDSRLNYPNVVVATVTSDTVFTITAGASGAIPSVTAGPFASGFVTKRDPLAYGHRGTSMILESSGPTQASFYIRTGGGSELPSGTVGGNHSVTIATTTPAQLINTARAYAFAPTSVYELYHNLEVLVWEDGAVDTAGVLSQRVRRTQVVPNPDGLRKFRIRAKNQRGMTIPVGKIVSASKSASTTATITTDVAHGLTTGDVIHVIGLRDQTNFANTSATVASIVNGTQFTVVIPASVTATSYGGTVYRVNGGNIATAIGAVPQSVQSVTRTSNILTVVGSATWTTMAIGDYVNLHGVRLNTDGSDLGVDGAYRVQNIATTTLTLEPITNISPIGANIVLTNCGGAVIKRTDMRLSFIRITKVQRMAVEFEGRNEANAAFPVTLNSTSSFNVSQVGGTAVATTVSGGGTNRSMGILPAVATTNADVTSAARTATGNSGIIAHDFGQALGGFVNITAASGTNPTLDISLEEAYDGTNFTQIWMGPRRTGISTIIVPPMQVLGRRRWVWTIGGSTPSFTFTITTTPLSLPAPYIRQFIDRTIVPNTLNSVTPTYFVPGIKQIAARYNLTTLGAPAPTIGLDISDDGTNWGPLAAGVIATATGITVISNNTAMVGQFVRGRVTAAGTGAVLSDLTITGLG